MSKKTKDCKITVDYVEVEGSPTGTIRQNGSGITCVFECAWKDVLLFAQQLAGYTVSRGGDIITYRPHKYKDMNLFVNEVEFKPIGTFVETPADKKTAEYKTAFLTAYYKSPEYGAGEEEEPGGVYATETFDPAVEFMTLPRQGLKWKSDGASISANEAPAILVPMMEWNYTLHRCPSVPNALLDIIGLVNNKTYKAKGMNQSFAVETLLCCNPHIANEVLSDGTTAYAITVKFLWRPWGHNKFPRPSISGSSGLVMDELQRVSDSADVKPYPPVSFDSFIDYSG